MADVKHALTHGRSSFSLLLLVGFSGILQSLGRRKLFLFLSISRALSLSLSLTHSLFAPSASRTEREKRRARARVVSKISLSATTNRRLGVLASRILFLHITIELVCVASSQPKNERKNCSFARFSPPSLRSFFFSLLQNIMLTTRIYCLHREKLTHTGRITTIKKKKREKENRQRKKEERKRR